MEQRGVALRGEREEGVEVDESVMGIMGVPYCPAGSVVTPVLMPACPV